MNIVMVYRHGYLLPFGIFTGFKFGCLKGDFRNKKTSDVTTVLMRGPVVFSFSPRFGSLFVVYDNSSVTLDGTADVRLAVSFSSATMIIPANTAL
eukprot:6207401-Pleurochrysis_carterae.AAC.9